MRAVCGRRRGRLASGSSLKQLGPAGCLLALPSAACGALGVEEVGADQDPSMGRVSASDGVDCRLRPRQTCTAKKRLTWSHQETRVSGAFLVSAQAV